MKLTQFHIEPWQIAMLGWIGLGIAPSQPLLLMVSAAAIGYLWRDGTAWTRHAKLLLYALLVALIIVLLGYATRTVSYHLVALWLINAGCSGSAFCLYLLRKRG